MKLSVVVVALYIQKLRYSSSTVSKATRKPHIQKGRGGEKEKLCSRTTNPQISEEGGVRYINLWTVVRARLRNVASQPQVQYPSHKGGFSEAIVDMVDAECSLGGIKT